MADQIKELFNKKFTTTEITSGTTFNFTTDSNTAFVIKDIQSNQSAASIGKVSATASIGLTSDFSASPSKFTDLGTIASATVEGASGSEIMDASSTFSIRVPAQAIAFKDIVQSQTSYVSSTNATTVEGITPTVDNQSETALTPSPNTQTSFGSHYANALAGGGAWGQKRFFAFNTHTNTGRAVMIKNDGNSSHVLYVGGYSPFANYFAGGHSYYPYTTDGRFVYNIKDTNTLRFHDLKGESARNPATEEHGTVTLKNAAGTQMGLPQNNSSYPKQSLSYFTDNGKRNILISPRYDKGLYWYELPDYDDTSGTALSSVPPTTNFYQLGNYNWTSNTSSGPNSNRASVPYIMNSYSSSASTNNWYIGTTASSTTKRVLIFQNGDTTNTGNRLFFMIADTENLSQTSNNTTSNMAYALSEAELSSTLGWKASSSIFSELNSITGYVQCSNFKSGTGSAAEWGTESEFWLDQDILYFTNVAANEAGEGPIIAWNLKTHAVSAVITWAQFKDSGNNALDFPGAGGSNMPAHNVFVRTPTTTETNARTYTKAPSLQVRATAIKEDRS